MVRMGQPEDPMQFSAISAPQADGHSKIANGGITMTSELRFKGISIEGRPCGSSLVPLVGRWWLKCLAIWVKPTLCLENIILSQSHRF